jgi:hypothetical protein
MWRAGQADPLGGMGQMRPMSIMTIYDDFMYGQDATTSATITWGSVDDGGTGTNAFQDALGGVFNVVTAAADNVLITIDQVMDSCKKVYTEKDVMSAPRILGVDVARFGDDRSVIQPRQGLQAFEPKVFTKMNNMDLVARIVNECVDFQPDAVFIDAGRGEGVIDRLRQLGHNNIHEVNFGGKPINELAYKNKRTEMWCLLEEWITQGGALPQNTDLKADLVCPTYQYDAITNKKILESKDSIKERLGKSPDIADALALTFAMPVLKRGLQTAMQNVNRNNLEFANGDYDIFAN